MGANWRVAWALPSLDFIIGWVFVGICRRFAVPKWAWRMEVSYGYTVEIGHYSLSRSRTLVAVIGWVFTAQMMRSPEKCIPAVNHTLEENLAVSQ